MSTREDEIFLLLNGALTVWAGDQRRELSDGGVAFLPKIPHLLLTSHRIILIIAPAPEHLPEAGWDCTPPPEAGLDPDAVATAIN